MPAIRESFHPRNKPAVQCILGVDQLAQIMGGLTCLHVGWHYLHMPRHIQHERETNILA